jgi:isoquinoline 1-oxidoreductase beta subunit
VKVVLTRTDDIRFDSFRSPSIQTPHMAFVSGGNVSGMHHHTSTDWPTLVIAPRKMVKGLSRDALRSARAFRRNHGYPVGA